MIEVSVNHLGAVQFEVKARQHSVYCDQPVVEGGYDEGITPPEFLLAALGTCAGYYAVQYLKAQKLAPEGLQIRVTAEKVKAPARLDDFRIKLEYPQYLDTVQIDGLHQAVEKCLIHKTLLHTPRITTEIEATDPISRAA